MEKNHHLFCGVYAYIPVMEQVIDYEIPANKNSALAGYDGSVSGHRTDGEISAKCDFIGDNLLALNLAHDVITFEKNVTGCQRCLYELH